MITVAAEVGMAHDGDWTKVAGYAAAAKSCGVDVLKLQCHLPEESSELEQWRVDPGTGEGRLEYWRRTAWDAATWSKVGQVIHEHGLQFGCSVFSLEAVALLEQVPELDIWKIPSGVSEWMAIEDAVCGERSRQVWASGGLSRPSLYMHWWQERTLVPMICTSLYPCPVELSGLGWARRWYGRPGCVFGWSDHTGDPVLVYAAAGMGASVIEVHFELGSEQTPDTSASWNPARLTELVAGIRRIEQGLASTDKDAIAASVQHLRKFYVPTKLNGRVAKHQGEGEPV